MIEEKFEKLKKEYTGDDIEILKANEDAYLKAQDIASFERSTAGKTLIKGIKADLAISLQKAIETHEGRYLSQVESLLNLLVKITSARSQVEAIQSWVDTL